MNSTPSVNQIFHLRGRRGAHVEHFTCNGCGLLRLPNMLQVRAPRGNCLECKTRHKLLKGQSASTHGRRHLQMWRISMSDYIVRKQKPWAHTNHQGKNCPVVFSNISFVCWFGKLSMPRAIFKKVQSYRMLLWKIHVRTIYMPIIRPTSLDGKQLQLRRIGYLLDLRDQPIWSFVWLGLRFCWAYKFVLGIWSYFCWHWCMAFLMVIFYKNKLCQFCRRW